MIVDGLITSASLRAAGRRPAVERLEAASGKRQGRSPISTARNRAELRHHIDDPLRHDHHLLDFTSPYGAHDIFEL